ncbi:hypothetical protein NO2_1528, partial [Candidatus Termititenax persephonae]
KALAGEYKPYNEGTAYERQVLQPSQDYEATEGRRDYRLDYLSPETCYAISQYLSEHEDSGMRELAADWQKRGDDSWDLYLACLKQTQALTLRNPGYVPAKAWVEVDNLGNFTVTPYGEQSWDGIRAPARLAAAIRYRTLTDEEQSVLKKYVQGWNHGYTSEIVDATQYFALALQLEDKSAAKEIQEFLAEQMPGNAVFAQSNKYYEASLLPKTWSEIYFSYSHDLQLSPKKLSEFRQTESRLISGFTQKYDPEKEDENRRYRQVGEYGYIYNDCPVSINDGALTDLRDLVPVGWDIINSESIAYGLLDNLADFVIAKTQTVENEPAADKKHTPLSTSQPQKTVENKLAADRIKALLNTLYFLYTHNYRETDTTLPLAGWAVMTNGEDWQTIQRPDVLNYGNTSAADADLLLLAVLIKIKEAGIVWGDAKLDYMIYRQAEAFIGHDLVEYIDIYEDEQGKTQERRRYFLNSGGFRSKNTDYLTGETIYEFYTSYQNSGAMQIVSEFFKRHNNNDFFAKIKGATLGNLHTGTDYQASVLANLQEDTWYIINKIKNQPEYASPENFPDKVYLSIVEHPTVKSGGVQVIVAPRQEPQAEDFTDYHAYYLAKRNYENYQANNEIAGLLRLPLMWNLADEQLTKYLTEQLDAQKDSYYIHYLRAFRDKINFLPEVSAADKLNFTSVSERFNIWDTGYPSGVLTHAKDKAFPLDNYEKSPVQLNSIAGYNRYFSSQIYSDQGGQGRHNFTILEAVTFSLGLLKNSDYLWWAIQNWRDALVSCLDSPDYTGKNKTTKLDSRKADYDHVYLVQDYLAVLSRYGWDEARSLKEINKLLALANPQIFLTPPVGLANAAVRS